MNDKTHIVTELKICPNCGELYDTSARCASDQCRARRFAAGVIDELTEPANEKQQRGER